MKYTEILIVLGLYPSIASFSPYKNAWINMYRKEITFVLSSAIEYQS